jgi:hypothetical protein
MKKLNLPFDEILEQYESGDGCYKIAKKFNCSAPSINNLLKKEGVYTKKTPNDYRKYKLNENYFEKINSEKKAYFLGLIYSDGNLYKKTLSIRLVEEDSYILDKFLSDIESDAKLYFFTKRKKNHKNQKGIAISNEKLSKDLLKLGVFKNKSLILQFPTEGQVPKKYLNHFIRGVFDGDGSAFHYERIINNKKYIEYGISIIGSNPLIDDLKKTLNYGNVYTTNKSKNSFITFKNKKEIKKFIDYIYMDATIFLKRKREKVDEILNYLNGKKFHYGGEKIIQYDLNGGIIKIWDNIKEIKENTNYNIDTILRNIKGKIKTSNKFKFKIYEQD